MTLESGTRIGPYEIAAAIGAGGMGEVYRATDSNLKRQVAIKVLPESLAGDAERLSRFRREAEVLAQLNHPNIAHIHGLERADGHIALVMELVEGESPKGPLPWDEAWKIAAQIAEALEYAHDRGVVHRDLKPANVLVTPDGVVKILDFGLAKAMDTRDSTDPGSRGPIDLTVTSPAMTQAGLILGTAAYMAPEQAKGRGVDKRADIWAFGVVLWELLTGERLFKGDDVADTLAQVLTREVDVSRAPNVARRLIAECLQRDPKARLRDIGDAKRLIADAGAHAPAGSARGSIWPWVTAVVFAVAAGVAAWAPWRSTPPVSELRFEIPRERGTNLFLSPDGQRVAITSDSGSIAIRELNALETRDFPLALVGAAHLIWSPDSRTVAYQSRDYRLMKMALDGSPPARLGDLPALGGGSWSDDGVILVGVRRGGLQRMPATGGTLTPVTTLAEGQTEHMSPQFIGGDRFLYQATGEKSVSGIYAARLSDPNGTLVLPIENADRNRLSFAYVPPLAGARDAHIVYTSQGVLLAQAVDPSSLALRGSATTIGQGATRVSASRNGTLTYLGFSFGTGNRSVAEWRWLDRTGATIGVAGPRGVDGRISPSGTRWARVDEGDIWLHDMAGGAPSRFTFEPTDDRFFTWSPDDQWIAYATGGGRAHDRILRKNTQTSTAAETVVSGGTDLVVGDWSRDGKFLLFSDVGTGTSFDLWTLDLHAKEAKPVPYLQTPAGEASGRFSPDGHWIAYASNESGQSEVYVQSFPLGGGKFQVSSGGGTSPRWRADGRELYFLSGPDLVAVAIRTSPRFEASAPRKLFAIVSPFVNRSRYYDVTPDGKRFLVLVPVQSGDDQAESPATVVVNWQAGLKRSQ